MSASKLQPARSLPDHSSDLPIEIVSTLVVSIGSVAQSRAFTRRSVPICLGIRTASKTHQISRHSPSKTISPTVPEPGVDNHGSIICSTCLAPF